MFTAALGRAHLQSASRLKVTAVRGGPTKGVALVLAHPDDVEEARALFHPTSVDRVLDRGFQTAGDAFLALSVFSAGFQSIALAGLVAGRGVEGASRELYERAMPELPRESQLLVEKIAEQLAVHRGHIEELASRRGQSGTRVPRSGTSDPDSTSDGSPPASLDSTPSTSSDADSVSTPPDSSSSSGLFDNIFVDW